MDGDIAIGEPPEGETGWRITVNPAPGIEKTVLLANTCISTSGVHNQFVDIDGTRYAHIIDPTSGVGLTKDVGITIAHDDGGYADALATAWCVLAARQGGRAAADAMVEGMGATIVAGTDDAP